MPTYRLPPKGKTRASKRRALSCEQCGTALGYVFVADDGLAMNASLATALCSNLREEIKRHEIQCPAVVAQSHSRKGKK